MESGLLGLPYFTAPALTVPVVVSFVPLKPCFALRLPRYGNGSSVALIKVLNTVYASFNPWKPPA